MNDSLDRADVVQILQEAGCSEEFTLQFLFTLDTEGVDAQLDLLREQRCRHLEQLHNAEKKLDRLDFLRYSLEKQRKASAKKG